MTTARSRLLLTSITWLLCAAYLGASEETLDRVKDLYRSAAYEEALAVLDQLGKESGAAPPLEVNEYRVLCLIALERTTEARTTIESIVKTDPLYQLSQASPRVRTLFREVRQSLLPGIVKHTYTEAKAAFDRQDPQSITGFERVLTLLNDPDLAAVPTLADLRTVASAFRDLSKTLAARPEPPQAPAMPVVPAAVAGSPSPPVPPVVHREGEPGVIGPEVLNQALPPLAIPQRVVQRESQTWQGILEVVIDENGDVISAAFLKSFHPSYDAQIVKAAMSWKYRPARKGGTAVRFLKQVNVRMDRTN